MIGSNDKLPFTIHLEELRNRLIKCFIAVGVGFVGSFGFKEKLFDILVKPLMDVMEVGDKLMFVAPGLYEKERRMLIPIVILSSFFFIGGSLFGYFMVFPLGFKFFLSFATETIQPLPSMKEYLGFSAKLLLAFGLVFELPLVLTFLARLGVVSVSFLKKNRKYALLLFFVGAAILTPPDVITQILMALPLMVLYEISIIGARLFGKKKPAETEADEGEKGADASESEGT